LVNVALAISPLAMVEVSELEQPPSHTAAAAIAATEIVLEIIGAPRPFFRLLGNRPNAKSRLR
jgi:hypothetical protein